jgi:hypothetical protein
MRCDMEYDNGTFRRQIEYTHYIDTSTFRVAFKTMSTIESINCMYTLTTSCQIGRNTVSPPCDSQTVSINSDFLHVSGVILTSQLVFACRVLSSVFGAHPLLMYFEPAQRTSHKVYGPSSALRAAMILSATTLLSSLSEIKICSPPSQRLCTHIPC